MWNLEISEKFIYFCEFYRDLFFQNEIQNFFEKNPVFY